MKQVTIFSLFLFFLFSCKSTQTNYTYTQLPADTLIAHIDSYKNKKIETEGIIVHICGVDGKKMKLKTENGQIIKLIPNVKNTIFDESFFYKQKVKVQGLAKESRINKKEIDKAEKDVTLLCHIDNTPCKDTAWVNAQKKKGNAEKISKQDIEKLRAIMSQTGKNYISVVTIVVEKVNIVKETKK
ncbi:MAG: hypothetical protein V2A54_16670 [Bacteroidota bacterium]